MLRFHTLGRLELQSGDGTDVEAILRQPKRLALLAYLVLGSPGAFQRRDTLLALFWPELDAARARRALSQSLYVLRGALGDGVVVGRGTEEVGVAEGALWCDAVALDDALTAGAPADALALYRGELLPGLHVSGAAGFERWLDAERDRLRRRALDAAWAVADDRLGAGDGPGAVRAARRALDIAPYDERALRRAMDVMARGDDAAAARRAYDAFARRLATEFGDEPTPETRALAEALRSRPAPDAATAPAAAPPPRSIAVLPFTPLGGADDDGYFTAGMTEDLVIQLSKVADLSVASRASVERYRERGLSGEELARELGVAHVLEGSVRRAGERVRITARLVDVRTGENRWAETYDRQLEDIFAIQGEVAREIAAALRAALSPSEARRIEHRPTDNMVAYELHLRARELLTNSREENETAIELFRQAIRLDPDFAHPYAGLANAYAQRVQTYGAALEWAESGIEAARRAIALDPELSWAHSALGLNLLQFGRYGAAKDAFRRAVELNPSDAIAMANLAAVEHLLGNFGATLRWARRALPLDPTFPYIPLHHALAYWHFGRDDEAEAWTRKTLDVKPDFPWALGLWVYIELTRGNGARARERARRMRAANADDYVGLWATADAALFTGEFDEARGAFERLFELAPDRRNVATARSIRAGLACTLLRSGETARAHTLLDDAETRTRRMIDDGHEAPGLPMEIAAIHALRGDADAALDWLERAHDAGWRMHRLARLDPMLEPLRDRARFHALLDRVAGEVRAAAP